MKTESPCPISDTTFTPPYPEPFYSWGTDFRTKYPQQNGRVLPKIIRRPLAYGKSYLTLEASEFSQNTGLLGPTESMLNKLSEFQLPLTLYSDLKIFEGLYFDKMLNQRDKTIVSIISSFKNST